MPYMHKLSEFSMFASHLTNVGRIEWWNSLLTTLLYTKLCLFFERKTSFDCKFPNRLIFLSGSVQANLVTR